MAKAPRYLIVSAMKNEGPYILEWVAHHLAIGFEHFLVVTNDCDDGTDRILDRLSELGHVTHVPNPKMLRRELGNWQVMALRYAKLFNIYRDAAWIMHSDVDEFLQINTRKKSLAGFFEKLGDTDVVSFTSVPFNSNGCKTLQDSPVVSQFSQRNKAYATAAARAKDAPDAKPLLNAVKTMFRNDIPFQLRRNHRPLLDNFSETGRVWRDGSGQELAPAYTDTDTKALNPLVSVQHAQLNHYAIRSIEAYLIKVDRGDVAGTNRLDKALKYWTGYNRSGDDDLRYSKPSVACRKIHSGLMRDAELKTLHEEAVANHQRKVTRILATDQGRDLAENLGYFT